MQNYLPQNFRELVASVSIIVGFIFSFISLFKIQGEFLREHALRIAAIFSLLGLCLFADDAYTYFAAVFIIATAVTQLEFLQTLAAIIRGNKDYFDFMTKVTRSPEETVLQDLKQEVDEIERAQDTMDLIEEQKQIETNDNLEYEVKDKSEHQGSNCSISPEQEDTAKMDHSPINKETQQKCIKKQVNDIIYNMDPVELALMVEEKTFKILEQKYNGFITRYVRFEGSNIELDGLMMKDSKLIIFEIKTVRRGMLPLSILRRQITKVVSSVKNMKTSISLRFVLVGNFALSQRHKIEESKRDIDTLGIGLEFDFYTFEEIGLSNIILSIYEGNRKSFECKRKTKQELED